MVPVEVVAVDEGPGDWVRRLVEGAHNAFASTRDEAKRRDRFVAAYVEAARAIPDEWFLREGSRPELPPARSNWMLEQQARGFTQLSKVPDALRRGGRQPSGEIVAQLAEQEERPRALKVIEWLEDRLLH